MRKEYEDMELTEQLIQDGLIDGVLSFRRDTPNIYARRFFRCYMDGSYGTTRDEILFDIFDWIGTGFDMRPGNSRGLIQYLADTGRDSIESPYNLSDYDKIEADFREAYTPTPRVVKEFMMRMLIAPRRRAQGYTNPRLLNLKDLLAQDEGYAPAAKSRLNRYFQPEKFTYHRLKILQNCDLIINLVELGFVDWVSREYSDCKTIVDLGPDRTTQDVNLLIYTKLFGKNEFFALGGIGYKLLMNVLIEDLYDDKQREQDEEFIEQVVKKFDCAIKTHETSVDTISFVDRTREMNRLQKVTNIKSSMRGYYDNWRDGLKK